MDLDDNLVRLILLAARELPDDGKPKTLKLDTEYADDLVEEHKSKLLKAGLLKGSSVKSSKYGIQCIVNGITEEGRRLADSFND